MLFLLTDVLGWCRIPLSKHHRVVVVGGVDDAGLQIETVIIRKCNRERERDKIRRGPTALRLC